MLFIKQWHYFHCVAENVSHKQLLVGVLHAGAPLGRPHPWIMRFSPAFLSLPPPSTPFSSPPLKQIAIITPKILVSNYLTEAYSKITMIFLHYLHLQHATYIISQQGTVLRIVYSYKPALRHLKVWTGVWRCAWDAAGTLEISEREGGLVVLKRNCSAINYRVRNMQ